jgi:hypothetical protein
LKHFSDSEVQELQDNTTLFLFANKEPSNWWNKEQLFKQDSVDNPVAIIKSYTTKNGKQISPSDHYEKDQTVDISEMCREAKVQLTGANFYLYIVLYNGAMGVMKDIVFDKSHSPNYGDFPLHVLVEFLQYRHNSQMVFNPTYPDIDMTQFKEVDWKPFYGDVEEAMPNNAPAPYDKDVDLRLYMKADQHAGDKLMRWSRTGFFIFLNSAPIEWYSKRQPTIESSVFGFKFVALKIRMERSRGLCYKIRMMGIPLNLPTFTFGVNMSMIFNTSHPESMLRKESNSICYHAVHKSVTMGKMITAHEPSITNPADIATKVLPC